MNDFRYALRQLRHNPGFSFLAVFILALGIAGNAAIFSIFNALYVRPVPFADSERLVDLNETAPKWNLEYTGLSYRAFEEWRKENRTFAGMAAWDTVQFNASMEDSAERMEGIRATHDLLSVLGINPVLGRGFAVEEDKPGQNRVVLLSHRFWERRFGEDKAVLGRTISLDRVVHTIIGVLPPNLSFLDSGEVWAPLGEDSARGSGWYLNGLGRLKPGATLAQARDDLARIHQGLISAGQINASTWPRLTGLHDRFFGEMKLVMRLLLGAVGVVLLVACANVAALMLARGMSRQRELGIRFALGASRLAVAKQLLVESLCLSVAAAVMGVLLGRWGLEALFSLAPDQIPRWINFNLDWRFALFCAALTIAAALVFGLAPVAQSAGKDQQSGSLLSGSTRSTGTARHHRGLSGLVIGELVLAVVLMICATLIVQAFRGVLKADPGFRPDNVLVYQIALPESGYPEGQRAEFFERHIEELRQLPEVAEASAVSLAPFGTHSGTFYEAEGAAPRGPNESNPVVLRRRAFPGYERAMGLTMLNGRFIEERDRPENTRAVVINESFARQYWPNQDPLGKRVREGGEGSPWLTVIGLAKDIKHYGLDQPMRPGVYLPYWHSPSSVMTMTVRGKGDPKPLLPAIMRLLQARDPGLPMFDVRTMNERLNQSIWLRRAYSWMFGVFAAVAVTMALGGIYGVTSYAFSQRTREIGIRLALGAQRMDISRLVLRRAFKLAGAGICLGLAGALLFTRLLATLLYGVKATDPAAFAGVPLLLGAAAVIACSLPARRAARVEPASILRSDG